MVIVVTWWIILTFAGRMASRVGCGHHVEEVGGTGAAIRLACLIPAG
jgi:hypothetical protein